MRALTALTLNVSLALFSYAADWKVIHAEGTTAVEQRRFTDAAALLQTGLDLAGSPFETAISANDLGVVLHSMGRDEEARPLFERSLSIWRNSQGIGDRIVRTAGSLATVYRALGEYRLAESLLRQTLTGPVESAELMAWLRNTLADMLREEGRTAEALLQIEAVLNMQDVSWRMRSDALVGRADLARDSLDFQSSVADWNRVIETAREHHDTVIESVGLRGLGQTQLERGHIAEAEPLLRRALAMFEADPRSSLHQIAATLSCMAQLYLDEDKLALAEESQRRAIELDEKSLGAGHPQVGILAEMLAEMLARRGQLTEARDQLKRASEIMAARFGENSTPSAAVYASWGTVEQRANNMDAAAAQYERALAILHGAGPDTSNLKASVMERYAMVLKVQHHKDEAKALLAQAKSFRSR